MLVVGGGIVGAGVALDAATRGLSIGLVEARDFGSGTSSRSSKLIHGGLRYLEQLNFGLVREALGERSLLLQRIAPHLVRPVSFLFPFTHHVWERAYVGDRGHRVRRARLLAGPDQGPARAPAADPAVRAAAGARAEAVGAAPARWCTGTRRWTMPGTSMTVVRTAASYGAHAASRTQVTGFLREGERVTGVRAVDLETGAELEIRAQQVVNATGRVDRRDPGHGRRPRHHQRARVQGRSTWSCPGTGSSRAPGSSCGRRSACCSSSRGDGTGSSARPTRTGRWTRRTRPPAGPTSTTCSTRSTGSWPSR